MINIIFSKMEAYSGNFGVSLKKLQSRSSLSITNKTSQEDESTSQKTSDKSYN
jgi:hypothetical protein